MHSEGTFDDFVDVFVVVTLQIVLTLSNRSSPIMHCSDSNLLESFRTVILVTLIYDMSHKCIQKVRLMISLTCLLLLHYKLY